MPNQNFKIAICDDDEHLVEVYKKWVEDYFRMNHFVIPQIEFFYNGESLMDSEQRYDIVLLDVEMPGMNGIYAGRYLMQENSACLIFVITSYEEYIDDALRFKAFRYITKPLDQGRLYRNLKDAIKIYTASNTKIAIETKQELIAVMAPEIVCFESQGHKLYVHTTRGNYLSVKKMNAWEMELNMNYFFRTHRSYIVNMEHVTRFDNSLVYLDNGDTAYLTRRKYTEFKRAYMMYLEGEKI